MLVAGRCFEILEPLVGSSSWPPDTPYFTARVKWLDTESTSAAGATLRAQELLPLINEWIVLARSSQRERRKGQLDAILSDLGPSPDADHADDLALWTAALICPLPPIGVAIDVRPAVLGATDALARVSLVGGALVDSIARMRTLPPGPIEVDRPPRAPPPGALGRDEID